MNVAQCFSASDDDESSDNANEESEDEEEEEESEEESDEDEQKDDGLSLQNLFNEDGGNNKDQLIDDAAAIAESIQPKGNTLSSTNVVTEVPFLLKHTLREYQVSVLNFFIYSIMFLFFDKLFPQFCDKEYSYFYIKCLQVYKKAQCNLTFFSRWSRVK